MAEFTATVYQNEFLPDGGTDVNAIVTVTCSGAGSAGQTGGPATPARSSSSTRPARWAGPSCEAAKTAASAAIDQILDGTWFAVVAGTHQAYLAFPPVRAGAGMVRMDAGARYAAHAGDRPVPLRRRHRDGHLAARWPARLFDSVPMLAQRHAILLTDGENHNETPEQLTRPSLAATGQVPVRLPRRRRRLAGRRGTPDRPGPARHGRHHPRADADGPGLRRADAAVDEPRRRRRAAAGVGAAGRAGDVRPPGLADGRGSDRPPGRGQPADRRLSDRARGATSPATTTSACGSPPRRSARSSSPPGSSWPSATQVVAQGLVKAKWSDDEGLTTRINPEVAHYTGQTELAEAIQEGLAAKAAGDEETATTKLGRAVQLAAQTGNEEATTRLRKVVDIEDPRPVRCG